MTDEAKALVERLEEWEWTLRAAYKGGDLGTDEPALLMGEAADRIQTLEAENERLREAEKLISTLRADEREGYAVAGQAAETISNLVATLRKIREAGE